MVTDASTYAPDAPDALVSLRDSVTRERAANAQLKRVAQLAEKTGMSHEATRMAGAEQAEQR